MSKRPPPHPPMDDNDLKLWKNIVRTVRPYVRADSALSNSALAKKGENRARLPSPAFPSPARTQAAAKPPLPPLGPTRASVSARLDLHGLTETQAFAVLGKFLRRAARDGHRVVLVITGKGRDGQGALRRLVPLWLESREELRALVAAASPAAPRDGGAGALYIRLARRKK